MTVSKCAYLEFDWTGAYSYLGYDVSSLEISGQGVPNYSAKIDTSLLPNEPQKLQLYLESKKNNLENHRLESLDI